MLVTVVEEMGASGEVTGSGDVVVAGKDIKVHKTSRNLLERRFEAIIHKKPDQDRGREIVQESKEKGQKFEGKRLFITLWEEEC
ncbi:hypothetical protein Tco_0231832 [Tanacetum coccineum]